MGIDFNDIRNYGVVFILALAVSALCAFVNNLTHFMYYELNGKSSESKWNLICKNTVRAIKGEFIFFLLVFLFLCIWNCIEPKEVVNDANNNNKLLDAIKGNKILLLWWVASVLCLCDVLCILHNLYKNEKEIHNAFRWMVFSDLIYNLLCKITKTKEFARDGLDDFNLKASSCDEILMNNENIMNNESTD